MGVAKGYACLNASSAYVLVTSITLENEIVHNTALLRHLQYTLRGIAQLLVPDNRHSPIGRSAAVDRGCQHLYFSQ
jgi:hypothetical protein